MSTKRLTDAQFSAKLAIAQGGRVEGPTQLTTLNRLRALANQSDLDHDHRQAREDVKRLAERLRERIGEKCCDFAYATTGMLRCPRCAADEALLSEVEAVRQ